VAWEENVLRKKKLLEWGLECLSDQHNENEIVLCQHMSLTHNTTWPKIKFRNKCMDILPLDHLLRMVRINGKNDLINGLVVDVHLFKCFIQYSMCFQKKILINILINITRSHKVKYYLRFVR
jgi:hypothetical protein